MWQQQSQLQQAPKHGKHKTWPGQVTTRGHRGLQGTLTANVRPQLVVIVLEQRVEDLCGISLLCLGGEDPGFIDAEVIVIVFLCALTPGEERQRAGVWLWQLSGTPWEQGHCCVSEIPKEEDAAWIKGRAQGAQGAPFSHTARRHNSAGTLLPSGSADMQGPCHQWERLAWSAPPPP